MEKVSAFALLGRGQRSFWAVGWGSHSRKYCEDLTPPKLRPPGLSFLCELENSLT
jgi:hypothetical protein